MKIKKEKLKKFFNNWVAPTVRGAIKTIPYGGVIVEVAQNIKHELQKNKDKQSDSPNDNAIKKPHRWRSIIIQLLGVSFIVYGLATNAITFEQVIETIKNITEVLNALFNV